jgi:hypothetical protein
MAQMEELHRLRSKHCKYENTDPSSAEDTAVPPNFNALDDGRVGGTCNAVTNFKKI